MLSSSPSAVFETDFEFHSLHLKTSSKALSQLSNASSKIHVKFPSPPAATLPSQNNQKAQQKKEEKNGYILFPFLMECRRIEIKGFGLYLTPVGICFPTGRSSEMRVRVGGCWGSTCCRCPTVLTAQIREGGKYLLETNRVLEFIYAWRLVPCKAF